MIAPKIIAGTVAAGITGAAMAGTVTLGANLGAPLGLVLGGTSLPILEGGILTVAVVGLVAGIRIVQRKKNRKG
ncbi:MAG: hypothetical protein ABI434_15805 [Burkholderiaceae bacterium]